MEIIFFRSCLVLAICFTILTLSCCDNEIDPCKKLQPVSAEFEFQQRFMGNDSIFAVDTVLLRYVRGAHFARRVYFSAFEEDATYSWKVGDDSRTFTEKEFFLEFDEPIGEVDVTLIVNKQPNTSCFPSDNGQDTVQHTLAILSDNNHPYAFEGTFAGAHTDAPSDVFEITIIDFGPTPTIDPYDPGHYDIRIFNLPKGCGGNEITPARYAPEISESTYREFYFDGTGATQAGDCPQLFDGLGKLSNNQQTLTIEYTIQTVIDGEVKYTKKKFVGTRKL
jgi:hypothetical protein